MAKEPAGLRRWRLAHRKHKRRRVVHTMARRRRSYRGYKRKGRRSSKAIPVLPVVAAIYPAFNAYQRVGITKDLPKNLMWEYTGFDPSGAAGGWNSQQAMKTVGIVIAGVIGHKVAGRFGINKYIKKGTMGLLQL